MKALLTAEWLNLVNITYDVEPALLEPYLPPGCEIDLIDGRGFISVVPFEFRNTKLGGFKVPGHVNFPEINLRMYVKCNGVRGVVFIKEHNPVLMVCLTAKLLYNEAFECSPVKLNTIETKDTLTVDYSVKVGGSNHRIALVLENRPYLPAEDTTDHYFKELEMGYGTGRRGKGIEYKVEHEPWLVYPVKELDLNVDYGKLFGDKWRYLNNREPFNVMHVKGSAVFLSVPGEIQLS